MKKMVPVCFLLVFLMFPCVVRAELEGKSIVDEDKNFSSGRNLLQQGKKRIGEIFESIVDDYKNFYSGRNLLQLGIGLGVSGIFANTNADKEIREWYLDEVQSDFTYDFTGAFEGFGTMFINHRAYLGAVLGGELIRHTKVGSVVNEWGWRSVRALLVGTPQTVLWGHVLGSSRPGEDNSHWHPFKDDNAVSGHSFQGAIPFLSAAQMTDNRLLKYSLYIVSTLPGLSRIDDDMHYFSQSLLGWWLAYLACTSVDKTEEQKIIITPVLLPGGGGVRLTSRF